LVIVERKEEDFFWKNESIWDCDTADGNFTDVVFSKLQDKQLSRQVLPILLQKIPSIEETFSTLEEFDQSSFRIYNAFYGAIFDKPVPERHINDIITYFAFRDKYLWDITPESLWERKEKLFSRLILCSNVKNNLGKIGSGSSYFTQIVSRLVALDRFAVKEWTMGKFSYRKANELSSLRISLESESTMSQKKYRDLRLFKTPDGTIECFELHIKTGDLRFHFFPDNGKIFVGYIGKHLPTAKY
jgi:hypothetical protein